MYPLGGSGGYFFMPWWLLLRLVFVLVKGCFRERLA